MPREDERRLRDLLAEAVRASRRSRRDLEHAMGVDHGVLDGMLAGHAELRADLLLKLTMELGFDPAAFFRHVLRDGGAAARRDSGWPVAELERAFAETGMPEHPIRPSGALELDAIERFVAEVLAEERSRLGLAEPPYPPEKRGPEKD